MLELNSQHIDQIRNYFISGNEAEKTLLQNTITPIFLKGFLEELKVLFIYDPNNETKLFSIALAMGASKELEALKEIQQQFYSQLAEMYLAGDTSGEIDEMLNSRNNLFLDEVNFQKEIRQAFIANEREILKKKFNEIDAVNNISQSDMKEAFNQIERSELKEKFKELDASYNEVIFSEDYMVAEPSNVYGGRETDLKASIKFIKFNWTRYAIAASIISLLLTTTIIVLKQDKNREGVAVNKSNNNKQNSDTAASRAQNKNRINELLANNSIDLEEKQLPVLKEQSFGFSSKDQKIKIRIYNFKNRLTKLEGEFFKDTSGLYAKALNKQIDSLKNLLNKYNFKESTLSIYQMSNQEIKLFKIDKQFFIKIGDVVYDIKKSSALLPLKKVSDVEILKMIDKIIFTNSN